MSGDWRVFRPAIWAAMIGIALILVLNPPYIGAALWGGDWDRHQDRARPTRSPGPSPAGAGA